jgi:hypothetical protein
MRERMGRWANAAMRVKAPSRPEKSILVPPRLHEKLVLTVRKLLGTIRRDSPPVQPAQLLGPPNLPVS